MAQRMTSTHAVRSSAHCSARLGPLEPMTCIANFRNARPARLDAGVGLLPGHGRLHVHRHAVREGRVQAEARAQLLDRLLDLLGVRHGRVCVAAQRLRARRLPCGGASGGRQGMQRDGPQ